MHHSEEVIDNTYHKYLRPPQAQEKVQIYNIALSLEGKLDLVIFWLYYKLTCFIIVFHFK